MADDAGFRRYLNAYQSLIECNEDIGTALNADSPSVRELKTLLEELEDDFSKFKEAWERCEDSIPKERVDEESRKFRALKREIRNRKGSVEKTIEELSSSTANPNPSVATSGSSNQPCPKHYLTSLKDFPIPDFDGEATHWYSFWDSFNSLIHSRDDISNVAKFNKLKSHLKGRALKAIASFPIADDSYNDAIARLESSIVMLSVLCYRLSI